MAQARNSRQKHKHPAPTVAAVIAPVDAPGVVYAADAAAPALKFFRCEPLRATMSQRGCGERWRLAQVAAGELAERFGDCRSCPIGAAHAGGEFVRHSPLFGAAICPRCRRGTTRMIQDRVCVGCRNREYEIRDGRNARGNPPSDRVLRMGPRPVEMIVVVDGVARTMRPLAADLLEPMIQTLRTTRGELAFARAPGAAGPRQGRLL